MVDKSGDIPMGDLFFISLTILFFLFSWGLVVVTERLMEDKR
jgi:hypothetical protein